MQILIRQSRSYSEFLFHVSQWKIRHRNKHKTHDNGEGKADVLFPSYRLFPNSHSSKTRI